MPLRAGLQDGENYIVEQMAEQGYSKQEVSDYLRVKLEVIENFWPAKKATRSKKVTDDG